MSCVTAASITRAINGGRDHWPKGFSVAIAGGDMQRFDRAVDKYGIAWTIFPDRGPLVERLDESPRWRRLYADERGVIHVRRDRAS